MLLLLITLVDSLLFVLGTALTELKTTMRTFIDPLAFEELKIVPLYFTVVKY